MAVGLVVTVINAGAIHLLLDAPVFFEYMDGFE